MNVDHNYSQLRDGRFYRSGPHFIIEAHIYIDGDMISCDQRLEVLPVLSGKDEQVELPFVLVNGKDRHRAYKQMCSGMGQLQIEKAYRIYKEMKAKKDLRCWYRHKLSYAEWMDDAVLELQER